MDISEKVFLTFSIKKCKKNDLYQIKIKSDSPTLEIDNSFETEKLKCQEEGMDLQFRKILALNYRFNIMQKIQIIIKREVYQDQNKHYILNEDQRYTNLSSLVTSPNSVYERPLEKNKNHNILSIELNGNPDNKKNSLFNFFKEGLKLSCFFSMDFSQGLNKQSIKDSKENYKSIIKSIIKIILYYSKGNYFIYGYGATLKDQINSNSINQNIFNINTNENEKVTHENIFNKINKFPYNNIIPKKKVVFSNMLKEITNKIFKIYNDNKYYNLLFIFARELIEDNNIQETKNILDEMEKLPISIVVICEGQNDFSKMNEIKNYSNKFKFIECKDIFNKNTEKGVERSLEEIGKQIIDYYKSVDFKNISKRISSFAESYAFYKSIILSQKEYEEENKEHVEQNKEDKEENKEKIISKFYNFQKIHEEYKKKKNNGNNETKINVHEINQNNGINILQVSNNSNQYKKNSYFCKPYQNGTDLLGENNYITPSYNSNYNNNDIINPFNKASGAKESSSQIIPNIYNEMNMHNEKNNRNTNQVENEFCLLK